MYIYIYIYIRKELKSIMKRHFKISGSQSITKSDDIARIKHLNKCLLYHFCPD